jgi:hypothetical protein
MPAEDFLSKLVDLTLNQRESAMEIRSRYRAMTALFILTGVLVVLLAVFSVSPFIFVPLLIIFSLIGAFVRCPTCHYPIGYVAEAIGVPAAPERCSNCGRLMEGHTQIKSS